MIGMCMSDGLSLQLQGFIRLNVGGQDGLYISSKQLPVRYRVGSVKDCIWEKTTPEHQHR